MLESDLLAKLAAFEAVALSGVQNAGARRVLQHALLLFRAKFERRPVPPPDISNARLIWVVANNTKTGPVLTGYVYPRAAAKGTCAGCRLFRAPKGLPRCYSWGGRAEMRLAVMERRIAEGKATLDAYSLERLLHTKRGREAGVWRLTAIGDLSRVPRGEIVRVLSLAREFAATVLPYTHFWADPANADLRQLVMASCNSPEEADRAIDGGWVPTAIVPSSTPKKPGTIVVTPTGRRLLVCPQQTASDRVTCQRCRLCDPSHPMWKCGNKHGIAFVEH